jgi:hypothetical protein
MRFVACIIAALILTISPAFAAESTTGSIVGDVRSSTGAPVAAATVTAISGSGRYSVRSDVSGRFTFLGVAVDTYVVAAGARGYERAVRAGVTIAPGTRQIVNFTLEPILTTIATVHSRARSFTSGSTADSFTVTGESARAESAVASASGLGNYSAGSVQGAIALVPGVDEDSFANAVLRGGKVEDASFDYDSVPVPQGIVAEPGGNIVGAQLPTTGIAATTVTLAGFEAQGENALGGIIDEIPATGVFPARTDVGVETGFGARSSRLSLERLWATPDRRWRYALAASVADAYFSYGDGHTFYPAEAGTYGLALQSRATSSVAGNVHYALDERDDLSVDVLTGEAVYAQYGTPYAGETLGAFSPGVANPAAAVTYASGLRGSYDVVKTAWAHTSEKALTRVQLYQSRYASAAGGPFWDDLSFPDGVIALSAQQGAREDGLMLDVDDVASVKHEIKYGVDERIDRSFLDQIIPTADEHVTSRPAIASTLAYLGDTWSIDSRLDLTGAARFSATRIAPSDGAAYTVAALDPHLSSSYRLGAQWSLRATYDHTTVAPKPLEADRTDSAHPAPFVPLGPETANDVTASIEGGSRTRLRATYFAIDERNRIDVLPFNFRSSIASNESPSGIGVPSNAGDLRAHGLELWAQNGHLTVDADYVRAYSSSASQFAFNGLNAAAVAAGHLFPVAYIPDLEAQASYQFDLDRHRIRISPSISYESGYPYGNGTMIWVFDPVTNEPERVRNDNYWNPGYNYYFLKNPALPYNATSNPYIATMGTSEGADPNTLRTTPQTMVSLHVEADLRPRLTAVLDVFNLFDVTSPTQMQGNPYLIGPPGYAGGDPAYVSAIGSYAGFPGGYQLGNGVPSNDGVHQALPWTYGRAGYVPMSYPLARTAQVTLRYRL